MTVITCDRCGKKIVDSNYDMTAIKVNERHIDLCSGCQIELNFIIQTFIRGEDVVVEAMKKE